MGAFEAIKAGVFILAGMALGWLFSSAYSGAVTVPAAREAGRVEERIGWQTRQAAAEARARQAQAEAQSSIDAIEREYYERDKGRALQIDALETALEKERANEPSSAGRACVCRPAIPRGVRDALDAAGRGAAARPAPAKPPAALR